MSENKQQVLEGKVPEVLKPVAGKTPAEQLAADSQTIAGLQARIVQLEAIAAKAPVEMPKGPVETKALKSAIKRLEREASEDLKESNPRQSPNLSLSSVLGVIPELTKDQRAIWNPVRDSLRKQYDAKHRELWANRRKTLDTIARRGGSTVATDLRIRKDGTVSKIMLRAGEKARKRAKKPDAKPEQVAAKMPKAGNAAEPAKL